MELWALRMGAGRRFREKVYSTNNKRKEDKQ